jgi:iron complex outermembrane recepter protein
MSGVIRYRRAFWLVFALAIAPLQAINCSAAEPTVQFDVPTGPLDKALRVFAAQANLSVLAGSADLDGKVAPALKGEFTLSAALTRLLAGQALHFEQTDSRTVIIEAGAPLRTDDVGSSTAAKATAESSVESPGNSAQSSAVASDKRPQKSVEEVVVTGSHIKGFAAIFPVETYTGKQLTDQGYTDLAQFFAQFPANFAGISQASNPIVGNARGAGTNQTFGTGVDLGGLGPGTTLVLWNGHRLPSGVTGQSVDISAIPLAAIDHIDIVRDGASATYGSDALGGVVNIVTVSDFVGLATTVRADDISKGKGANPGGNVMAGNSWPGGGALLMIDNQQDYPLSAAERAFGAKASEPTDLLPEQRVTSGYASAHQESDGLITRIDVLMSSRRFNAYDALYGYLITLNGRANQLDAVLQLDYAISPAWSLDLVAQFAQETDVVTTTYPAPVPINTDHYVNRAPSFESHVEGPLGKLAGEDVNIALGAEFRQERFTWSASYAAPLSTQRNITSAFGEMLVPLVGANNQFPLVQQLVFDVTARYDGYSDFGSSYVPKGVLRWKMNDSLSWRASYSLSFKSPTLYQFDSPPFAAVVPPANAGETQTAVGNTLIIDGGNTRLKPERTRSFEVGFGYQPESLRELKLDFVARHISYTQRIDQLSQDGFTDDNVIAEAPVLGHLVTLSPSAAQVQQALNAPGLTQYTPVDVDSVAALAYLGFQNVGSMSIESFAATFHYRREFGQRILEADLDNSYFASYEVRITPQSAPTSLVGGAYRPIRLRSRLNVTFMQAEDWAFNVRANLTGSYRNDSDPACPGQGGCPVSAWVTLDAAVQYSLPETGGSPLRGMRVAFGVTNAFNRPPPYLYGGLGVNYDPANASPLGRTLAITVTKQWGHG